MCAGIDCALSPSELFLCEGGFAGIGSTLSHIHPFVCVCVHTGIG